MYKSFLTFLFFSFSLLSADAREDLPSAPPSPEETAVEASLANEVFKVKGRPPEALVQELLTLFPSSNYAMLAKPAAIRTRLADPQKWSDYEIAEANAERVRRLSKSNLKIIFLAFK